MAERGVRLFLPVDSDGKPYGATNPMPVQIGGSGSGAVDVNLHNHLGNPYDAATGVRLPVDIGGASLSGTFETKPSHVSTLNEPAAPLLANETFTGAWEDVLSFSAIQISIFTDQASSTNGAVIQFSDDGVNVLRSVPTTIPANFAGYFHLAPQARYVRFVYTNGATAQTVLRVSVIFSYVTPAEVVQPIGAQITDANVATIMASHIKGRIMSGPSTGAWTPLGTDGAGRLLVTTPAPTDARTLTERMFAKAPAPGYALWLDTADVTHIYLAEAPVADIGTATTFRGVRVQKDVSGNPLGKVQILDGFVWDTRATAGWA